ncbi:MAG: hypothetical protein E6J90_34080 [Deltaproteobacteria bacterium]|nr:MAG: hypothetical protein E6J90_34080 [Deltaproteobacteria bacterium]TMQ16487.1 MAG: hypothetical protein E6J91_11660 [Deltaproteobacteria bacterium]
MKLAVLAFVTTLGLGGVVQADPAPLAPARPRGELHQLLLERFDRNHDGHLEPQERRRAIRALRRLARRLAMQERRAEYRGDPQERRAERRDARNRALLQRFDRNGDGVVTPDEMPPGMARRLRRADRNGDGSLDDRDQP